MAWFEFHTNLPEHQKTMLLEDLLKLSKAEVIGHLCLIWTWAMDNAVDGDISRLSSRRLAMIAGYNVKKAATFMEALIEAGFIDREGDSLRLHDWEDYGGKYHEYRKKANKRQERYRRAKSEGNAETEVTDTFASRDASRDAQVTHIEEIREDKRREQDMTGEKNKSLCDDDAVSARESDERIHDYCSSRFLLPEEMLGASEELISESDRLCEELFSRFTSRSPNSFDRARFFSMICGKGQIEKDSLESLCYAFEAAAAAGKGGRWSYIEGVLSRMQQRGISDLKSAELYELEKTEGI